MKHLSSLGALVLLTLAPAIALADEPSVPFPPIHHGPIHPRTLLTSAAQDLTDAAEAFSQLLAGRGHHDHVYQDALTLYDAAEHFEQEVSLGGHDLAADFQAIQDTFDAVQNELRTARRVQDDPAARNAWFRVSQANLQLRTAWSDHDWRRFQTPHPTFPGHGEDPTPPQDPERWPQPASPSSPEEGPHHHFPG